LRGKNEILLFLSPHLEKYFGRPWKNPPLHPSPGKHPSDAREHVTTVTATCKRDDLCVTSKHCNSRAHTLVRKKKLTTSSEERVQSQHYSSYVQLQWTVF